jgi:hypothetical protein
VCHYDFGGGGPKNPYGELVQQAVDLYPNTDLGRQEAVLSIENEDPDGDGFSTVIEVTDTVTFANTPTFPGLTPANVGNVSNVTVSEIQDHLVPSTGGDATPPEVTLITPNGGEVYVGNTSATIEWTATDASGVAAIDLYLSDDGGLTFKPIAIGLANTGSHMWFPANRPTITAVILVVAVDNAFNEGQDESDAVFTVESPPGGLAPTTLRDFDQPGSQPFEAGILNPPEACAVCHGNYDANVEPYFNWQGSMMSQASRDVLFMANMVIANQDAPDSGDLCLRCHLPRGWLQGRSVPTDGSQMLPTDESGVSCDFCHRLVDPIYDPLANPPEDEGILAGLSNPASDFGNGMATIDPTGARRGPFLNASTGHPVLVSPFHREAALCGTCHDVSNPAFEKDGAGNYVPNAFDAPATDFSAHTLAPVERTYSEWFYSEYNTPGGVYAPQFGGNLDYVSTCQDCHMRDVTGEGCNFGTPPTRVDLPLHDMTGGSTWLPGLLGALYPGEVNETALQAGIARARYLLQNAAVLEVVQEIDQLKVTITNNTGHKLPTGYPEGRRMWINVRFYDDTMALIGESAAYDPTTGILGHDTDAKIYDIEPGLDEVTAPLVGVDPGPSFHFVLNNKVFKDNRIPPRGFTNAAFADFGGAPVAYTYADGQYWDDTYYTIPPGATSVEITLYYQSTSKEFIEFLRDENTTDSQGQDLYDLWNNNDKCPPEVMQTTTIAIEHCVTAADCDDGLYCNGAEACAGTFCQPGVYPCPGEDCDEVNGVCVPFVCDNDGECDSGEDCNNCPDDCFSTTGGVCGDGICAGGDEDCFTCPADCRCTGGGCSNGCCGDGICSGENAGNCPVDCDPAFVPPGDSCCGDGICEGPEDDINCAIDCAACTVDADCDDGQYCNGSETCDVNGNCQPGTPVDCADTVDCTIDSCNETTDTCDHLPDDGFCDNTLYCDGVETCDVVNDCQPGTPVDCADTVDCTIDSCNETTDTCDHIPDDGFCDNTLYCDGVETCDPVNDCQPGIDPCPNTACDEVNDRCTDCLTDADCVDELYCNGTETCETVSGTCVDGTPVDCADTIACTTDTCNDETDTCDHLPNHDLCDDGKTCTLDTCDTIIGCTNDGTGVTDACDDNNACTTNDICQGDAAGTCLGTDTSATDCDDGNECTADTCDPQTGCDNTPVADGTGCTDDLYCTVNDSCTGGFCDGEPRDCSQAADQCNTGICDDAADACLPEPVIDGTPCPDGVFCNGDEICRSGICTDQDDPCPPSICNEENDTCLSPPVLPPAPHDVRKHRYLSIDPTTNPGVDTVIKIEVAQMRRCVVDPRRACLVDEDCDPVCVNDLDTYCTSSEQCGGAECLETGPCVDVASDYDPPLAWLAQEPQRQADGEWTARLSDTVYSEDWSAYTVLHIGDCPTVPCVTYHVSACDPVNLGVCSDPLEIGTQRFPALFPYKLYADVGGGTVLPGPAVIPPDGYVNVKDLQVTLLTIQNLGGPNLPQAHPTWVDLHGLGTGIPPNYILNVADLQAVYVYSLTNGLPWVNTQGGLDPQDCP